MSKLDGVFDISKLDEHSLGHLMYVLNSPSYEQIFEPYLQRMRDSLNARLLDPSQTRKNDLPDDFLRGAISTVDGLLTLFKRLIDETELERIARSQIALTEQEEYENRRREGVPEPQYNPAEDY